MAPTVGVYVHVPFCERVCPYCDFAVVAARPLTDAAQDAYVEALLRELDQRAPVFAGLELATLYLGGGTPSLLRADAVGRIAAAVRERFAARADLETTLEVNPSTLERERLPAFRAAGVSRLSVGVQSFDDAVLKRLGRAHRSSECRETLRAARSAGYANVSLDLIQAAPGQSLAQARRDLDEALAFGPEHVSVYELTIEAGTPFGAAAERGRLARPDEDTAVAMYEAAQDALGAAGYRPYEISSHARPGFESAHNLRYWARLPVLGLGVGAWSTEPPREGAPHGARRATVRDLPTYLGLLADGRAPEAGPPAVLDAPTARGEAIFLGLRTARGVDPVGFEREFGARPRAFFDAEIRELLEAGLLCEEDGALRLTRRGRRLSDSVFERFV